VSKTFIDTNVLVYAMDTRDPAKREKARRVLSAVVEAGQAVVSTQVAKEFYVVATTKLGADPIAVKGIIHGFRNMEIVVDDLDLVEQATDIAILNRLSFWDASIVAAAERARCDRILSEDLNAGQEYRGIRIVNPFTDEKLPF